MRLRWLVRGGVISAALSSSLKGEIVARKWDILLAEESWLSLLLSVAGVFWGPRLWPNSGKPGDLGVAFVCYAAIALGFCVGGMTIALTLPDRVLSKELANLEIPEKPGNAMSSLLFVFSWTALAHWVAICAVFISMIVAGHSDHSIFETTGRFYRTCLCFVLFLCTYSLFHFLITVVTLWQVGLVSVAKMRRFAPRQPQD
jgi:hypothetical protein